MTRDEYLLFVKARVQSQPCRRLNQSEGSGSPWTLSTARCRAPISPRRVCEMRSNGLMIRIESAARLAISSGGPVKILLLSMPDSFEHTPTLTIRMPNGALASLAGNVDPHHQVAIADLILVQSSVRSTVERLVRELHPDVVGLSVMTFQRSTARRIIGLIRTLHPDVRIVVGGYDPSLAPDEWIDPAIGVDVIVRGEGDVTFRDVIRAWDEGRTLDTIDGIWYRNNGGFRRNPHRGVTRLGDGEIRLPNRAARVLSGYTMMGRPIDVIETSRGCTFDCSFCSIIEMRGRNFHRFAIEHVIEDIRDASARGARCLFIVDDNITLDVPRFEELCTAIIRAGLNTIDYIVQAMTASIASHGRRSRLSRESSPPCRTGGRSSSAERAVLTGLSRAASARPSRAPSVGRHRNTQHHGTRPRGLSQAHQPIRSVGQQSRAFFCASRDRDQAYR